MKKAIGLGFLMICTGIISCIDIFGFGRDQVKIEDDKDQDLFGAWSSSGRGLHMPYFVGEEVVIRVSRSSGKKVSGWYVTSEAPWIFMVGWTGFNSEEEVLRAHCSAGMPGETEIHIFNSKGKEMASSTISVVKAAQTNE